MFAKFGKHNTPQQINGSEFRVSGFAERLEIRNSKLETRNSKLETRNSKLETIKLVAFYAETVVPGYELPSLAASPSASVFTSSW